MGHAKKGVGVVGWLKRSMESSFHFKSLKGGSSMLNVVHSKKVECKELRRLWNIGVKS